MVKGGMHGEGGHVLQRGGACMAKGGMCGKGGHVWQRGVCVAKGGMCGMHAPPTRYSRSMHGWYASYWNAFLLKIILLLTNQDTEISLTIL